MTRNLRLFIGLVILGTTAYLAASDGVDHLSGTTATLTSWVLLIVFLWVVFDLVFRVIYRLAGVTDSMWLKERTRPTHQQAEEMNKYWLIWLGGSLSTYVIYTLIFHRLEWKGTLIFGAVIVAIVGLARLNSKQKIAGHTKEEIFK